MLRFRALRRGRLILAAGVALAATACSQIDELMEANNPDAIPEEALDDATLINVLTNSVIGRLAEEYDDPIIWVGSHPTDEQVSGINWPTTQELGARRLKYDAGPANDMFRALSRIRFMADSVSTRLNNLLENPQSDRRMALVLAYGGYAYTFMAEIMCEATINVGAERYTPDQLADMAIARFQAAIPVAQAAGADDVLNLAYTGLARAAMAAGDPALAMQAAENVDADFIWWVEYKENSLNFELDDNVTGNNHTIGVHPRLLAAWGTFGDTVPVAAQTDPRVQFNRAPRTGHDARTILYTPFQPLSYSGYTGTLQTDAEPPVLFDNDTDIRLGSYLDAMHNYYEAAGPTGTGPEGTTLEFVNARRAVGNQPPVNLAGDELMAELREQRMRDLFLGGFRLGDLRRWKAQGIDDPNSQFPTGDHVNETLGAYGDIECFPIPIAEYVGNPNIN
jgi:hypothetical protein